MHVHIHKTWDHNTAVKGKHTVRLNTLPKGRNNAPVLHQYILGDELAMG